MRDGLLDVVNVYMNISLWLHYMTNALMWCIIYTKVFTEEFCYT